MITIVGEAPSQNSDPKKPFDGWSGKKLAQYCGMTFEELRGSVWLRNVLSRWPGKGYAGEKGSSFPKERARKAAARMRFHRPASGVHVVLFAGKRVARAFGLPGDYFSWEAVTLKMEKEQVNTWPHPGTFATFAATIPHPSGCCRFWNYEANRRVASDFLSRVTRDF